MHLTFTTLICLGSRKVLCTVDANKSNMPVVILTISINGLIKEWAFNKIKMGIPEKLKSRIKIKQDKLKKKWTTCPQTLET